MFSNLNGSAKQPSKSRDLGQGAKGRGRHLGDGNGCSEVYRSMRGDPQGWMVQCETLLSLGPRTSLRSLCASISTLESRNDIVCLVRQYRKLDYLSFVKHLEQPFT